MADEKQGPRIGYSDERARAAYDLTMNHLMERLGDYWRDATERVTPRTEIQRQQQSLRTPGADIALPRDARGRFLPRKQQPIGGPSRSYRAGPEELASARAKDLAARYPTLAQHLSTAQPTSRITARGQPGYDTPWDHTATWWRHAREKYPKAAMATDLVGADLLNPDVTYGPADWALAALGPAEESEAAFIHGLEHLHFGKKLPPAYARSSVVEGAAHHGSKTADYLGRSLAAKGVAEESALDAEQETGHEVAMPRYEDAPQEEQDASEPEALGPGPVTTPSREDELAVARQRAYEQGRARDAMVRRLQTQYGGPSVSDLYRRR